MRDFGRGNIAFYTLNLNPNPNLREESSWVGVVGPTTTIWVPF